ncbi:MAG: TetR/AcrR family transcriptional regulator [Cyanobacteria bacterium P01_G01_bin.67]
MVADTTSKARRKRTPSPKIRQKILEAAQKIFLTTGFSNTSMDEVARQAKVSKNTIYNHFKSKNALFEAIITDLSQNLLTSLLTPAIRTAAPETALTLFATRFLEVIMSEPALALKRLVLAEALRFPKLGELFYRSGPERAIQGLAEYLTEQNEKQTLAISEPLAAAEQFLNTLTGFRLIRNLLGIKADSSLEERDRFIMQVVSNFLKAHQVKK